MMLPMALMVAMAEPVSTPKAMQVMVQMMPREPRMRPRMDWIQLTTSLEMPLCSISTPAKM